MKLSIGLFHFLLGVEGTASSSSSLIRAKKEEFRDIKEAIGIDNGSSVRDEERKKKKKNSKDLIFESKQQLDPHQIVAIEQKKKLQSRHAPSELRNQQQEKGDEAVVPVVTDKEKEQQKQKQQIELDFGNLAVHAGGGNESYPSENQSANEERTDSMIEVTGINKQHDASHVYGMNIPSLSDEGVYHFDPAVKERHLETSSWNNPCINNPGFSFLFTNKAGIVFDKGGCDFVSKKRKKRCKKTINGKKVRKECPEECGLPSKCTYTDKVKPFKVNSNGKTLKLRCKKLSPSSQYCDIPKVKDACAFTCNVDSDYSFVGSSAAYKDWQSRIVFNN